MATISIPADVFAAIEEWPCFFDAEPETDEPEPWPENAACPWCGGRAPEWIGCRTAIVAKIKEAK